MAGGFDHVGCVLVAEKGWHLHPGSGLTSMAMIMMMMMMMIRIMVMLMMMLMMFL